jgi:AcrR family transcriptional regulator
MCFQAQGFHATSMGDIIKAAGLSAGAVYGYFKSKDELILAAADASMREMREELAPLFDKSPPPPKDFLRQVQDAIDEISGRGPIDLRRMAVLGWAEAQRNDALRHRLRSHYDEFLTELVRVAQIWRESGVTNNSDPTSTAKLLLSVLFGLLAQTTIWESGRERGEIADIRDVMG